eukprot:562596-Pelagomonas_calceolata.AAC.2
MLGAYLKHLFWGGSCPALGLQPKGLGLQGLQGLAYSPKIWLSSPGTSAKKNWLLDQMDSASRQS